MQIRITKLTLSPPPSGTISATIGWRCNGSTGAYNIATSNAQVQPNGTLVTPVDIIYDGLACPNGIQVIAYTNCGGEAKVIIINPNAPTTTSTTTKATTTTSTTSTSTTTTTTISPTAPCADIDSVVVVDAPNPTTTTTTAPPTTSTTTTVGPSTTTTTTTICPNVTDIEWVLIDT